MRLWIRLHPLFDTLTNNSSPCSSSNRVARYSDRRRLLAATQKGSASGNNGLESLGCRQWRFSKILLLIKMFEDFPGVSKQSILYRISCCFRLSPFARRNPAFTLTTLLLFLHYNLLSYPDVPFYCDRIITIEVSGKINSIIGTPLPRVMRRRKLRLQAIRISWCDNDPVLLFTGNHLPPPTQ